MWTGQPQCASGLYLIFGFIDTDFYSSFYQFLLNKCLHFHKFLRLLFKSLFYSSHSTITDYYRRWWCNVYKFNLVTQIGTKRARMRTHITDKLPVLAEPSKGR